MGKDNLSHDATKLFGADAKLKKKLRINYISPPCIIKITVIKM